MNDSPPDPPATRNDVRIEAVRAEETARVLHAELMHELERVQEAIISATRTELQHASSAIRADVRLSRAASARGAARLMHRMADHDQRWRRLILSLALLLVVIATLATAVGLIAVAGG